MAANLLHPQQEVEEIEEVQAAEVGGDAEEEAQPAEEEAQPAGEQAQPAGEAEGGEAVAPAEAGEAGGMATSAGT